MNVDSSVELGRVPESSVHPKSAPAGSVDIDVRLAPPSPAKDEEEEKRPQTPPVKTRCDVIRERVLYYSMEHPICFTILFLLTIFTVFMEDLSILVMPVSADEPIHNTLFAAIVVFVVETLLQTICRKNYAFSLVWWLDCVSLVSLVLEAIEYLGHEKYKNGDDPVMDSGTTVNLGELGRVAHVSREGERIARVLRAIKTLRLLRIFQFCRIFGRVDGADKPANESEQGTRLGTELAELASRRVIILVVVIMFVIPLLQSNSPSASEDMCLNMLALTYRSNNTALFQRSLNIFNNEASLLFLSLNSTVIHNSNLDLFRVRSDWDIRTGFGHMIVDRSGDDDLNAIFSLCTTILIVLVLMVSSYVFENDNKQLIVQPVVRMRAIIDSVSDIFVFEDKDAHGSETEYLEQAMQKMAQLVKKCSSGAPIAVPGAARRSIRLSIKSLDRFPQALAAAAIGESKHDRSSTRKTWGPETRPTTPIGDRNSILHLERLLAAGALRLPPGSRSRTPNPTSQLNMLALPPGSSPMPASGGDYYSATPSEQRTPASVFRPIAPSPSSDLASLIPTATTLTVCESAHTTPVKTQTQTAAGAAEEQRDGGSLDGDQVIIFLSPPTGHHHHHRRGEVGSNHSSSSSIGLMDSSSSTSPPAAPAAAPVAVASGGEDGLSLLVDSPSPSSMAIDLPDFDGGGGGGGGGGGDDSLYFPSRHHSPSLTKMSMSVIAELNDPPPPPRRREEEEEDNALDDELVITSQSVVEQQQHRHHHDQQQQQQQHVMITSSSPSPSSSSSGASSASAAAGHDHDDLDDARAVAMSLEIPTIGSLVVEPEAPPSPSTSPSPSAPVSSS